MTCLVVTGTGTEVGKTVVTAAIAAVAAAAGLRVAVVKVAQTGIAAGDESDVGAVARLTGLDDLHELVRYPEPLAPASAARRAGLATLTVPAMITAIEALSDRDLVLVEGAGGLLVRLDDTDATLADVASGLGAPVVVVATAGLGTLNATALTCEALRARQLTCAGVVIGAWPRHPELAAVSNLDDFASYAGAPLVGALAEAAGRLDRSAFLTVARDGLAPSLGGTWRSPFPDGPGVVDPPPYMTRLIRD
jgi:dethiobiotin synthetase